MSTADDLDVLPATAALLLSTVQEALRNVVKHSRARRVEVSVEQSARGLVLEVTDDGIGFDVAEVAGRPRRGHLALRLLADRAAAEGATLAVRTAPGAGTSLRLDFRHP